MNKGGPAAALVYPKTTVLFEAGAPAVDISTSRTPAGDVVFMPTFPPFKKMVLVDAMAPTPELKMVFPAVLKLFPCKVTEDESRVNGEVPEPVPEKVEALAVIVPPVTNDAARASGEVLVPVPVNCEAVTEIVPPPTTFEPSWARLIELTATEETIGPWSVTEDDWRVRGEVPEPVPLK